MQFLRKLKLKRLNTAGVGHHVLIAVIVISAIAGVGAYRVWQSGATASSHVLSMDTKEGCSLAGRNWSGGDCKNTCVAGAGTYSNGGCSSFVSGTPAATCTQLGRVWLTTKAGAGIGCAQYTSNQGNSPRCFDVNRPNYIRREGAGADSCDAPEAIDNISKGDCMNLLGRQFNDSNNNCRRYCLDNSSIQLSNGVYYCGGYVAPNITSQDSCENYLFRKWVVAGCAKRGDSQDNAVQCKIASGYPNYYKDVNAGVDACGKTRAAAKAAVDARNAASSSGTIVGGSQTTGALGSGGTVATNSTNPTKNSVTISGGTTSNGMASNGTIIAGDSSDETIQAPSTVKPTCTNGGTPKADGSCTKGELTCPGADVVKKKDENGKFRCYNKAEWQAYNQQQKAAAAAVALASSSPAEDQAGTKVVVSVDDIAKEKCHLLGREFLAKKKGKQPKGCLRACQDKLDAQSDNKLVCLSAKFNGAAYAESLDKDTCDNLHRQYVKLGAGYCAQFPNQEKKSSKKVNADQCAKGYPVYIIQPGKKDECVTATFANQMQIVADKTKKSITSVAKFPGAKVCNNLRKNMHWNGKSCVSNRVAEPTGGKASDVPGGRGAAPQTQTSPTICAKDPDHPTCPKASQSNSASCKNRAINGVCLDGVFSGGSSSTGSKSSTSGCSSPNTCGDTVKTQKLSCDDYKSKFGFPSGGYCWKDTTGDLSPDCFPKQHSISKYLNGVFYSSQYVTGGC